MRKKKEILKIKLEKVYSPPTPERKGEFLIDCACLFSKRNTDITSNIAKTQH